MHQQNGRGLPRYVSFIRNTMQFISITWKKIQRCRKVIIRGLLLCEVRDKRANDVRRDKVQGSTSLASVNANVTRFRRVTQ